MKKYLSRIILGLAITSFFLAYNQRFISIDLFDRLELLAYDARLSLTTGEKEIDPRVVIIDLDERSLVEEGHWPWNRAKLAKLVENLFDVYKLDILGFDVVFAERDSSEQLELLESLATKNADDSFLQQYQRYKPLINADTVFANEMSGRNVVLGYYFDKSVARATFTGEIGPPLFDKDAGYYDMLTLQQKQDSDGMSEAPVTSFTGNVSELQAAAQASGFYSIGSVDKDGILRRIQLLEKFNGGIYQSLSLALTQHYLGLGIELSTSINEQGNSVVDGIDLGTGVIPMDTEGTSYIPYKGKAFNFRYVSATDVLNQKVENAEDLESAIGIVGTTAAGLVDLRNTPLQQNNYPGVEVHAATIVGLLDAEFRSRPYYSTAAEFIILLAVGLFLSFVLPPLGALGETATWFTTSTALAAVNMFLWVEQSVILSIAPVLLLALSLYIINTTYGYLFESRAKQKLGKLFGQYIPPELVQEMTKDPEAYSLEAKKKELTVLFTDVRGFTTISEGLEPKELALLMNTFLSSMTKVVHDYGGTIDKYMGDAMMAFWGAPIDNPDHAHVAVDAAIEMMNALNQVNNDFAERGWPPIKIGIGLNTGDMSVGNMGSEFRMAYTVLGDAVNLGSRIEGITKNYGVDILVSEYTAARATQFEYQQMDIVKVKGKDEPVAMLEPLGLVGSVDEPRITERDQFHAFLNRYRGQQFEQALSDLKSMQNQYGNKILFELYAERCNQFLLYPPDHDWDGVFVAKSK